jgi:formate hydrogenlyase transcriptional activator
VRRDLEKEQQYPNERRLAAEGIQSMCVVPLALQGKCIGLLSVVSQQWDLYSNEDAGFLQEVANQVALAVQNMQSYQEIDSLKARLEKENVYLREELRASITRRDRGYSPALLKVPTPWSRSSTDSTVSFTAKRDGKKLARAIHSRSSCMAALVSVNCSAISAGFRKRTVWAYERRFTGRSSGALASSCQRRHNLPDEIGELCLRRSEAARVLQEHELEPVGSSHPGEGCVIAATNRNLVKRSRRADSAQSLLPPNVFPSSFLHCENDARHSQLVAFCLSQFSKRLGRGSTAFHGNR